MSKSKSFLKNFMKPFTSSNSRTDQNESELEKIAAQEQKQFSFETLVAATKNFNPSLKLGEGGFGPVYKGKLEDGREIAVKKLSQSSSQGKREFQSESNLLARVSHRNVVNLLGYCVHRAEKLLVYEYVANESLDKILFKSDKREALDWKRRYEAILGIARGLLYLHEEAHGRIIHRDIKASNILLDEKWTPKIADFGMARLYPEKESHVNTRVAGTNGYMAPEYLVHGHLSTKADVYSFGVVVIELVSGHKNSSFDRDPDSQNLLDWAYKMYKRQRSLEIMDPTLAATADPEQAAMCIQIGLLCVQSDQKSRPDMGRVVLLLSKKPTVLEEPLRPGIPGTRYRRRRKPEAVVASTSSASGGTHNNYSGASDFPTFGSSAGTQSSTTSASTNTTAERLDPRGKRPVND